jgi:hypothetical protein
VYALAGLLFLFSLYTLLPHASSPRTSKPGAKAATGFDGKWNPARDSLNLMLNDNQCAKAFPGLFDDISRAIQDRSGKQVSVGELEQVPRINGYIRGMVYNQEVRFQTRYSHLRMLTLTLRI